MYDPNMNAPPLNPLPWVVVVLACTIGGVEAVFQAAQAGFIGGADGIGWRLVAVQKYAFSDEIFDQMRSANYYPLKHLLRFFSYSFIQVALMQTVFALVFVLAIGKFVAEKMHPLAVLLVFFGSAAGGAAVYSIFFEEQYALIGAYPAIYGLIGAYTWIRFSNPPDDDTSGFKAFSLIIVFLSIALVYKAIFGGTNDWFAELIGFSVGFLLAIICAPNRKARIENALTLTRGQR